MKELTTQELDIWTKGGNIDETVYFVMIKTASCPKCMALLNKKDIFGNLVDNLATYTYKPNDTIAAAIMTNLEIASVPVLVIRFRHENMWKLGLIRCDDHDDLQCTFDALNDNDQVYFGWNEWDERQEDNASVMMNRLLRLIYGEIDPEKAKERRILKKEVGN